jgi:Mitochondrial ribosomal protein (VAR1)
MARDNYLKTLKRFSYLLMVNSAKFEKPFAWKLLRLIKNIYNKEVQFNTVNLNKMHLNSDIYTQAVSLKLRNRDNKLFKVLTSSLSKVKLPNVSRISEKYNKSNRDEYLINKIRNVYVNSMFNNTTSMDPLNNLLLAFFSRTENLEMEIKNRSSIIKRPISLYKYIIRSLKHLKLAGIRIEAKGRLTRRFTASKSVFKVRWKGGLKNVDSSFKGLSAIMLRGDRKSNVQYSMLSSKNRNGAFGVKGWVSSK